MECIVIRARCCDVARDVFLPGLPSDRDLSFAVEQVVKMWQQHIKPGGSPNKDIPPHPFGGPAPALTIRITFEELPL
jgi:hypothetical protein